MLIQSGERLLFTGDSITDAGRARPVGEGLHVGVGEGYVRYVETILGAAYPDRDIRISNTGTSGDNIRMLAARWQTDVMDLQPDWLSILIGVNDVWRQFDSPGIFDKHISTEEYRETLEDLVAQGKSVAKGIILMSPYYMEPLTADRMRARMDEYRAIMRETAKKCGTIYVDLQDEFDKFFQYRHSSFVAWDRVHPNHVGCMIIARAFLKAVGFDRDFL